MDVYRYPGGLQCWILNCCFIHVCVKVLVVRMLCFAKYRCYLHAGHSAGRSQCQVAAQNPADSASASVTPLSPGPGPGPGNDDKLPVSNQICLLYSLFRDESQHQMLLISQFTECFLYRVDAQQ